MKTDPKTVFMILAALLRAMSKVKDGILARWL
jgi:hypothetical protein